MSYKPSWVSGDWIADCDVCGRTYKASQLQQRWDGLMCCSQDWEIRQPQDFVRGVADFMNTPWSRIEPEDQFIQFCTIYTINGLTGVCTASCAVAGKPQEFVLGTADS